MCCSCVRRGGVLPRRGGEGSYDSVVGVGEEVGRVSQRRGEGREGGREEEVVCFFALLVDLDR